LELLRRRYRVFVGKAGDKEIDFVAVAPNGETEYIQVSYTVRDETTLKRELSSLMAVRDFHKRTLLTMDLDAQTSYEGIAKVNVLEWMASIRSQN
jgi:predicted AAA+ superfamily ATPase